MQPVIEIPKSEFFKLKRNIERIAQAAELSDMITEKEAAQLLSISVKRIQNLVCENKMDGLFTVGFGGKRFYSKSKIIGLQKI